MVPRKYGGGGEVLERVHKKVLMRVTDGIHEDFMVEAGMIRTRGDSRVKYKIMSGKDKVDKRTEKHKSGE